MESIHVFVLEINKIIRTNITGPPCIHHCQIWEFIVSLSRKKIFFNKYIHPIVSYNIIKNEFVLFFMHIFFLLRNTKLE